MQKWLWIILHQRFSSYTTAFLKNVEAFKAKRPDVFLKRLVADVQVDCTVKVHHCLLKIYELRPWCWLCMWLGEFAEKSRFLSIIFTS